MTKQTIAATVSFLVSALVLGSAIFVSLPSTVLYPRDGSPLREVLVAVLPESWPFFTKPPSDSEIIAYVVEDGTITSASSFPNARSENWFGIKRAQRAQGPEMANLSNPLPAEQWVQCDDEPDEDCLVRAAQSEAFEIVNDYPAQTLCGSVIIAETKPVAFPYQDLYTGWRLDVQAAHLEVTC